MTPTHDLEAAAGDVRDVVGRITDDQLDAPTPCTGATVADLLSHLLGLAEAFRAGAAKEPDSGPPPAEPPPLDPDWRRLLPQRLDALVAAWREPAAWSGTTSVGGVEMPAAQIAIVALDELVLHGWDVARASGQPYEPRPDDVQACLGFVAAVASPEGTAGLFGPALPVADEAPAFTRLLALSGRDAAWTPEDARPTTR